MCYREAFNPEDGLEMILDADDGCVLRGECERVLLTRCPPRDSNVERPGASAFGGTVYGFIRDKTNAEVLSMEDDREVRRLLNGWFGPEGKSGGGRLAVPSSGFYGTFWFRKICDAVTVYGVPPPPRPPPLSPKKKKKREAGEAVGAPAVEYSTANFVMHNIHNFTTEHGIYRAMAKGGRGAWINVNVKPMPRSQLSRRRGKRAT